MVFDQRRVQGDVRQADGEHAPFFTHGIAGVAAQIDQNLVNLCGVTQNERFRVELPFNGDGHRQGRPDQCQGLINDMLDLNGPHVLFALATEIENLLDQIGCPVAGTENAFQIALKFGIVYRHLK